jgi:hypothetical protein
MVLSSAVKAFCQDFFGVAKETSSNREDWSGNRTLGCLADKTICVASPGLIPSSGNRSN